MLINTSLPIYATATAIFCLISASDKAVNSTRALVLMSHWAIWLVTRALASAALALAKAEVAGAVKPAWVLTSVRRAVS